MQYTRNRRYGFSSSYFPPGVKWLLISNIAVFVIHFFLKVFFQNDPFSDPLRDLMLSPRQVLGNGYVWQLVTYMFLHQDFWHIILNMFGLWMFGVTLEGDWGTRRFLQYYFLCGVGAAICVILLSVVLPSRSGATLGASGAIYGLLLAFGVLYPDTPILFSFLFPIKAKYFVMIFGAIEFMSLFPESGVSHIAHLGGMLFGFVFLKFRVKRRTKPAKSLRSQYEEWKLQRARRKFEVYLRKHDDNDRWRN